VIPVRSRWKRQFVWGLVGCGWLWAALVLAAPADQVVPIGSITINPMANNRRAVMLRGKVKDSLLYQGGGQLRAFGLRPNVYSGR